MLIEYSRLRTVNFNEQVTGAGLKKPLPEAGMD